MARIDRFTTRAHAQLACGLLTTHGIDAYVSGDDAGGAYPQLAYGSGGTVVVVPDELVDAARELLDEHLSDAEVDAAAAMADELDGSAAGHREVDAAWNGGPHGGAQTGPHGEPPAGHVRHDAGRRWTWLLVAMAVVVAVALVMSTSTG